MTHELDAITARLTGKAVVADETTWNADTRQNEYKIRVFFPSGTQILDRSLSAYEHVNKKSKPYLYEDPYLTR